ncbi:MAG: DNA-directed RNA polymerase subunit delta [Bacilli bacterium]
MDIKKMPKEELEELSYTEIAYHLLQEKKKTISIRELFEELGNLLEFSKKKFEEKIADFYTAISTDKRFIVLDAGIVDLRSRYSVKIRAEDLDNDDYDDVASELDEGATDDNEDDDFNSIVDDEDYEDDNEDLKDLLIVDEKDLEE